MKWRDWQLLIILFLLLYIGIGVALLPRDRDASSTAGTPTVQPTSPAAVRTVVIRQILPTKTPPPTRTPRPTILPTLTLPSLPSATLTMAVSLTPTAPPTDEVITYVVQQGDNLTAIAARHGTTLQALVEANDLGNADLIYPGQRLIIRVVPWASPTPAPTTP